MKAELELMQGEREESSTDLENVRNLLDLCTGQFNAQLPGQIVGTDSINISVTLSGVVEW